MLRQGHRVPPVFHQVSHANDRPTRTYVTGPAASIWRQYRADHHQEAPELVKTVADRNVRESRPWWPPEYEDLRIALPSFRCRWCFIGDADGPFVHQLPS